MRLVSVNVALPKPLHGTTRGTVLSGIDKKPIGSPVRAVTLGLDGDGVGDPVNHGGALKAIYAYDADDYAYWREQGLDIPAHGWFGENFTIAGASSDSVRIGDIWSVGSTTLQVTEPRSPCYKLERKVGFPHFAAAFQRSGRVGFYLSVIEEGMVSAPDDIRLLHTDGHAMTVRELSDFRHYGTGGRAMAERVLALEHAGREWQRRARKLLSPARDATR